jgi:nitrite reductase/ring-hydroxylating ferredoxin subunit
MNLAKPKIKIDTSRKVFVCSSIEMSLGGYVYFLDGDGVTAMDAYCDWKKAAEDFCKIKSDKLDIGLLKRKWLTK